MSIWPLPGVPGEALHQQLRPIAVESRNVTGIGGSARELVARYLKWSATSHHLLRLMMRPDDLNRLFLTPRYWATLAYPGSAEDIVSVVIDEMSVVSRELEDLERDLASRLKVIHDDQFRSSEIAYAALDTNVFLQHEQMYDEIDWHAVLVERVRPMANIRLVVPILVLEELDATKHDKARGRARLALKRLYDHFGGGVEGRRLLAQAQSLRGEVSIQLLFDPPGHSRRPIADDEIIDRTVAWRWFVGREIEFVTYDTATALRATSQGLRPHRLQESHT